MRFIGTVKQVCEEHGILLDTIPEHVHGCRVVVNNRLKTCFGKARWRGERAWIELNPLLFNDQSELFDTIAHEVAHLCAGPKQGHGPLWQRIAETLGANPSARATKEAAKRVGIERQRKARKVVGVCRGCGTEIERAQRLPSNRVYHHKKPCGGLIQPV